MTQLQDLLYLVGLWVKVVLEKADKLNVSYEAEVMADETYTVRSVQSTDTANLSSVGFGALDILDGVEIIGVTPTPPEDYMTTSTGGFPIMIIYGMAGLAAVGRYWILSLSVADQ